VKSMIDSTNRKLLLEQKVKQAAQSLRRLEDATQKWANKANSTTAYTHLDEAQKKCDEITADLWRLTAREMDIERKLLNHNAGVLSLGMNILERKTIDTTDDFGEGHLYRSVETGDDVPSIRFSPSRESISKVPPPELTEAQNRLRELNFHVATLARTEISSTPTDNLTTYIDQLKSNINTLTTTHTSTIKDLQSSLTDSQRILEQLRLREQDQMEAVLKQNAKTEDLERRLLQTQREFDRVQNELEEQNDIIGNLKQEVRTAREEMRIAETVAQGREAESLTREKSLRRKEVERLNWEITAKDEKISDLSKQLMELRDRIAVAEQSVREAQDKNGELERQHTNTVRDLESQVIMLKSETASLKAEKDEIVGNRQQRLEEVRLQREHDLAKERQAQEIRANEKVLSELEAMKAQNEQLTKDLENTQAEGLATEARLKNELDSLEKLLAEPREDSGMVPTKSSQGVPDNDRERELEGRCDELQNELSSILDDFERLTSQFIDHESFRQTLESQIDALRDQCNTLQSELAFERVKALGRGGEVSSPTQGSEQTSTTTLRSEFRKMVAEIRQEHLAALKVFHSWMRLIVV
jgi:chromosome segregation ATPase